MKYVNVGNVASFPDVAPDKEQALKVLEEAAEVFGAWQQWRKVADCFDDDESMQFGGRFYNDLLSEISDCIQACCNLSAALDCHDLTRHMEECRKRNEESGRYDG